MSHPPSGNGDSSGDINHHGRRIQELVEQIEAHPDESARALVHECLQSVLGFYGQGLERILQILKRSGAQGRTVQDELIRDRIVSGLLLIHGLHPIDLETRLHDALDKVRPYMESHGGNVELLTLENDFARLRLQGACKTCPSSAVTMELAVRQAIEEACPDLAGFEVEGAVAHPKEPPHGATTWTTIEGAAALRDGALLPATACDVPLVICRLDEHFYAYRDRCPVCNVPLHLGTLEAGMLSCGVGHRFSVRDAGRSSDDRHLDPFPLLVKNETVRVAVAEPAVEAEAPA